MIFDIELEDLKRIYLPFVCFLPPEEIDKISVRYSYITPVSVKIQFTHDNNRFIMKQYFMDWFYYGFPKNQLRSAVDFYGDMNRNVISKNGMKYEAYSGPDYRGLNCSTTFIYGTCIEMNHPPGEMKSAIFILEHMEPINFRKLNFLESSFYANYKGPLSWFEEERIARLFWRKTDDLHIWDYSGDATGLMKNTHRITILRNTLNEYMWIDVAAKGTGIKNLRYNLSREGNIFTLSKRTENEFYGSVSPEGPFIMQRESQKFYFTVSLPRPIGGTDTVEDNWSHIENLNLDEFLP